MVVLQSARDFVVPSNGSSRIANSADRRNRSRNDVAAPTSNSEVAIDMPLSSPGQGAAANRFLMRDFSLSERASASRSAAHDVDAVVLRDNAPLPAVRERKPSHP